MGRGRTPAHRFVKRVSGLIPEDDHQRFFYFWRRKVPFFVSATSGDAGCRFALKSDAIFYRESGNIKPDLM
jgi:hypothetical protein